MSETSAAAASATWLRFEATVRDAESGEIASAEAFAAGAAGLEECDGREPGTVRLVIYTPVFLAPAVRDAVAAVAGVDAVGEVEACPPVDWAGAWRDGLEPLVISRELVVRPSCTPHVLAPGQSEVVIDPGQAFGTGGHESTRLALDLLAALPRPLRTGARVLDVGAGSGVLALAALRLGASEALGVDIDPVTVAVARSNALANGLGERARFVAGSLDAAEGMQFDLVLANLLKRELLPLLPGIARCAGPGARILSSGLLASEAEEVLARCREVGFEPVSSRERTDASGTAWIGLELAHRHAASMPAGCQSAGSRATGFGPRRAE